MCSMKLSTNTAHLISEKGTSLFLPPNSDCESCTCISAFHQTIINNARWSFRLLASGNNSRQKPCSWTVELAEWAAGGPEAAQGSLHQALHQVAVEDVNISASLVDHCNSDPVLLPGQQAFMAKTYFFFFFKLWTWRDNPERWWPV